MGSRKSFKEKVKDYWPFIFDALKMAGHPSILKAAL